MASRRAVFVSTVGVGLTLFLLLLTRAWILGDLGGGWLVGGALLLLASVGVAVFFPARDFSRPARVPAAPAAPMHALWWLSVLSMAGGSVAMAWMLVQLAALVGPIAYALALAALAGGAALILLLVRFKPQITAWGA